MLIVGGCGIGEGWSGSGDSLQCNNDVMSSLLVFYN